MNNKLTIFQEDALDFMFYEHNDYITWYNLTTNPVKFLSDNEVLIDKFEKFTIEEISDTLLDLELYFQGQYKFGIVDFNEKNISELKTHDDYDFIREYYINDEQFEEQIEKDSTIQALEQIFTYMDDNTYNRYLEGKLKIDPHNNSDEDFDVVCEKYEYYDENTLLEEIESYKYNFKQIMNKYYQLGRKGV